MVLSRKQLLMVINDDRTCSQGAQGDTRGEGVGWWRELGKGPATLSPTHHHHYRTVTASSQETHLEIFARRTNNTLPEFTPTDLIRCNPSSGLERIPRTLGRLCITPFAVVRPSLLARKLSSLILPFFAFLYPFFRPSKSCMQSRGGKKAPSFTVPICRIPRRCLSLKWDNLR